MSALTSADAVPWADIMADLGPVLEVLLSIAGVLAAMAGTARVVMWGFAARGTPAVESPAGTASAPPESPPAQPRTPRAPLRRRQPKRQRQRPQRRYSDTYDDYDDYDDDWDYDDDEGDYV